MAAGPPNIDATQCRVDIGDGEDEIVEPGPDGVTMRPATASDLPRILDLLEAQEFVKPLTRDDLYRLFMYPWRPPGKPYALVVEAEGRLVGVMGTIYSPELESRPQTNCMSTLYIEPRFRIVKDRAARTARQRGGDLSRIEQRRGAVCTCPSAHGPNDTVARWYDTEPGWVHVSDHDIFTTPGASWTTLRLHRCIGRAHPERLTADERRIVEDHTAAGCQCFLVGHTGFESLIVAKRTRRKAGVLFPRLPRGQSRLLPVSEVLYVSRPEEAIQYWGRIVAHLCWRQGTVGTMAMERFFVQTEPPPGRHLRNVFRAYNPKGFVDKLYTEIVVMP